MKARHVATALVAFAATTSCTSNSAGFRIGERLRPTPPADVTDPPAAGSSFAVVGTVHSHCRWNWFVGWAGCRRGPMIEQLRVEASRLGADAVLDIERTGFWQYEWTDVHYRGIAVRWTDP